MNIIIFLVGLIISFVCILIILAPTKLKRIIKNFLDKDWMIFAVIIRIILGAIFILFADQTRYPGFIYWFGIVILLVAIILPIIGKDKINKFIKFWLDFPTYITFIWAIIGFLLGLFIMYTSNIYI